MSFTPDEIVGKKFTTRFRGFDREEVTAFLEEVANFLASLIRERNELKDKLVAYTRQIALLKKQEAEFRTALTSAYKAAEDMKVQAEKEADVIIDRAKLDADRIVSDAHKEALALEDRIRRLRMMQRETVHKMRSSFESFLRILDDEMALPPEEFDESVRLTAKEIRSIQEEVPDADVQASKGRDEESVAEESVPLEEESSTTDEDGHAEEEFRDKGFDFEPEKLWPSS